jgi:hypothetical protein
MTAQPDAMEIIYTTREEWLQAAVGMFRGTIARIMDADPDMQLAIGIPDDVLVGVGFPFGCGPESASVRAVTYIRGCTGAGVPQVFMCPTYEDEFTILCILLHELIHVSDDCESGHRGFFVTVAKALGLRAPFTTATATPTHPDGGPDEFLTLELQDMMIQLGRYPHHAMDIDVLTGAKLPMGVKLPVGPDGEPIPTDITLVAGKRRRVTSAEPRQRSRWFKFGCANDECALSGKWSGQFTRSVVALATPICPACHEELAAR